MFGSLFLVTVILVFFAGGYLHLPKFGSLPKGRRLENLKNSVNYRKGRFRNLKNIPVSTMKFSILKGGDGNRGERKPSRVIPSIKTDLLNLDRKENVLVWFGHSSCFFQINQIRFLIDPVFSTVSSPVMFFPKAFSGTDSYKAEDIPDVDYLIITHDHWDHLDYQSVIKMRDKIGKVICPLGVGAHLERWLYKDIIEMDWGDKVELNDGFFAFCLSSQHFSGRGFLRNRTLWASFLIETNEKFKIYISGDGGYNTHFSQIGEKFGDIDFAIMENGQYNCNWSFIHMHPEETVKAIVDLKAKVVLPVHWGKFSLSTHSWNEPLKRLILLNEGDSFRVVTPVIGEKVYFYDNKQIFSKWWEF